MKIMWTTLSWPLWILILDLLSLFACFDLDQHSSGKKGQHLLKLILCEFWLTSISQSISVECIFLVSQSTASSVELFVWNLNKGVSFWETNIGFTSVDLCSWINRASMRNKGLSFFRKYKVDTRSSWSFLEMSSGKEALNLWQKLFAILQENIFG